jgi:SAM-dependent methyltransferase
MKNNDQKQAVRDHYGKIAQTAGQGCGCGGGCGGDKESAVEISVNGLYPDADKDIVREADLGLGCGSPGKFSGLKQGMTVLDLGSGAGIDVFLAAREVGSTGKVIGLDMTDEMLDLANTNKQKLGMTNTEFRKGEIEHMPIDSDSVDHVISNCVINLVPDKRKAFSEIFRVLKKGGSFTVSDIVYTGEMNGEYRKDLELWASCVSGALEKSEYLKIVSNAGFSNISVVDERSFPVPEGTTFVPLSITVKASR